MMGLQDAASGLQRRLGSSSSLLWATPLGFNPARLFGPTDTGWVYDLSDMSTLFQEAAGITPVTGVNQPVGLCLDKSGRGNHRSQSASLPRPTYARHPLGGIRNLLTRTEEFDNADWNKTFSGTGVAPVVTPNSVIAPDGSLSADRVVFNAGAGGTISDRSILTQTLSPATGTTYVASVYVRADAPTTILWRHVAESGYTAISVGTSWQRVSLTQTSIDTASTFEIGLRSNQSESSVVYLWGAQLELGSTATAYQRVVSVFDVTEAGVPDLYYLSYDGLNDSMSTAPFAWGSDKATVVAGVRKLSDATSAILLETSETSSVNNGTLFLTAPGSSGASSYAFRSRGQNDSQAATGQTQVAPITNVLTGIGDISGDRATLRVNGTQVAQSTADQGTGNYGTYPVFFGARAGTSLFFNGREYSNFAINRLLTANELTQIERFTAQRTGVTL